MPTLSVALIITVPVAELIWLSIAAFFINADSRTIASVLPLVLYVFLFLFFILLSALAFRAQAMGNMIRVSEKQLPELYEMVVNGSKMLGLTKTPETFLYNSKLAYCIHKGNRRQQTRMPSCARTHQN